MKYMIVVAHLDDEAVCLGGFMKQLSKRTEVIVNEDLFDKYKYFDLFYKNISSTNYTVQHKCKVIVMCNGRNYQNSLSRVQVFKNKMNELNFEYEIYDYHDLTLEEVNLAELADNLLNSIKMFNPNTIIVPSEYDLHQDHVITAQACKIAARNLVPELFEMYNPMTKILKEHYFDTSINVKAELKFKLDYIKEYNTEKLDISLITGKEKLKTIWREL